MRTYEERARYILKQRDERLVKRRRMRTAVTMSAVSVCSLALIVGASVIINNVIGKRGAVWISSSGASSGGNGVTDSRVTAPAAEVVSNPGELHSVYKFTMPEFPDVDFLIDNGNIVADGKTLFGGKMPIAVHLADLNGDGYRELCTDWGVLAPSTALDKGICALDFVSGEYYALSDPEGIEYHLSLEDGKLFYKYYTVLEDQSVEKREDLALSDMKRVSDVYFTNNGEAPAPEKVFLSGDLNSTHKFTMPEFPDVDFALVNGVITADDKKLFGGRKTPAIYLADLNNDGYREICTDWGVYPPSVPLDIPISAYDYLNDEYYVLSDPAGKDSRLTLEYGKHGDLGYSSNENWKPLAISDMKNVSEAYFINNGEDLTVEMVYNTSIMGKLGTAFKFTMPEFPDVDFTVNEEGTLTANGNALFGGVRIDTIYLADLNNDGYREICTDWGMPVPGNALTKGICVLDFLNHNKAYVLSDPEGIEEYHLSIEDGKLVYRNYLTLKGDEPEGMTAELTLSAMKRVTSTYFSSNGQNLIAEKVYDMNDHLNSSTPFKFTMPEFPGADFKVEKHYIYADGKSIFNGATAPAITVYLADLNGDGYREICSEIAFGSGIVDMRILVYDYAYSKLYELSDRGKYDYTLALEDGILKYKRFAYLMKSGDTPEEVSTLTLSVMKQVVFGNNGADLPLPPTEKLYPRNNSDLENILEINDNFEFAIPEVPETSFKLVRGVLSCNGEFLLQGYPIHSIYLADLNDDGVREVCAEYSVGEGIVNMNIFAYDPKAKELYTLSDTGDKEYVLTFENGVLGYKHCVYGESGITADDEGVLSLSVMNKFSGLSGTPKAEPVG